MVREWKYWNANGFAVAIVAVEGGNKDWTAYIGAALNPLEQEEETVDHVVRNGCKISKSFAEFLFPSVAAKFAWRK